MSKPQQIDLFALLDSKPKPPAAAQKPLLNGIYYERRTGLFVTYVQGRRHFEVSLGRCLGDKAWKEKTMRERAI
ncbi:hypothetical protein C162_20466 [Paenibacillus sp. FSL R7-269]|uniref:hypothetical protein n=1 Tax=Paenibacillus sp. FSL R7-269 TaxID=1226755 RepID=UPI0003E275EF|nr:hypothetical protein [Paenibacillus sp. FSL R7-269]ETT45745.1 hypothetical protein C162_20466 [Paenibacillus sp. FSL R7-269]